MQAKKETIKQKLKRLKAASKQRKFTAVELKEWDALGEEINAEHKRLVEELNRIMNEKIRD